MRHFSFTAIITAMAFAVAFLSPQRAGAFVANQDGIAKTAMSTNAIIEVKHKGTPPGWHHGRKVGWHGRGKPPGLAKKP